MPYHIKVIPPEPTAMDHMVGFNFDNIILSQELIAFSLQIRHKNMKCNPLSRTSYKLLVVGVAALQLFPSFCKVVLTISNSFNIQIKNKTYYQSYTNGSHHSLTHTHYIIIILFFFFSIISVTKYNSIFLFHFFKYIHTQIYEYSMYM